MALLTFKLTGFVAEVKIYVDTGVLCVYVGAGVIMHRFATLIHAPLSNHNTRVLRYAKNNKVHRVKTCHFSKHANTHYC